MKTKELLIPLLILMFLKVLLIYLNNDFLLDQNVVMSAMSGQVTQQSVNKWHQINGMLNAYRYVKETFSLLIYVGAYSFVVYLMLFLIRDTLSFKEILYISLIAAFSFLLRDLLFFFYFAIKGSFVYQDMIHFPTFSLADFFASKSREFMTLKAISLSGLLFIFLFGRLLGKMGSKRKWFYFGTITSVYLLFSLMGLLYEGLI